METGTQEYAAPERLAGAPPSAAGDVYALARLLTRLPVFRGDPLDDADRLAAALRSLALSSSPPPCCSNTAFPCAYSKNSISPAS